MIALSRVPHALVPTCLATAWLLSGCATVIHGTSQKVEIASTPRGATALILPGDQMVTTPASVRLERLRAYTVRLTLTGYETQTVFLDRVGSGAIFGNLVLGGIIGISVDASNGAAFQLVPGNIEVEMRPSRSRD